MKVKQLLITAYVAIGILYGLYSAIWGQYDYKGFFLQHGTWSDVAIYHVSYIGTNLGVSHYFGDVGRTDFVW